MKKNEKNKKQFKGLSNITIAILYLICGVAWLISGIINLKNNPSLLGYIDIVLAILWVILAVLYYIKYKKDKKEK